MEKHEEKLKKKERLCSKKLIDILFGAGGSHALTAFPLKAVYRLVDAHADASALENDSEELKTQVLISVPKKHFKRAVKRNRVKRQVREAYRKHRILLSQGTKNCSGQQLLIAFIWLSNELSGSATVEQRVSNLLQRIGERI